MSTEVRKY